MNMFMMHVRNFVGMCKFISWTCQNFCVYGRILMGIKILVMEKFCWVCDVGSWKFCGYDFGYVGVFTVVHGHGHVGIFSIAWLWEKICSSVWTFQKFWLW